MLEGEICWCNCCSKSVCQWNMSVIATVVLDVMDLCSSCCKPSACDRGFIRLFFFAVALSASDRSMGSSCSVWSSRVLLLSYGSSSFIGMQLIHSLSRSACRQHSRGLLHRSDPYRFCNPHRFFLCGLIGFHQIKADPFLGPLAC